MCELPVWPSAAEYRAYVLVAACPLPPRQCGVLNEYLLMVWTIILIILEWYWEVVWKVVWL